MQGRPKLGASWEGFAVEEVLRITGEHDAWFWSTQGQSELDLLVRWRGKLIGVEMKHGDAPGMTRSLHTAMHDLKLDQAFVVYPGNQRYPIGNGAEAISLPELRAHLRGGGR